MTGDDSLRARPMARVITPLQAMGARFLATERQPAPVAVVGTTELLPIRYPQPVASAQVKSAVLLAGLHAAGRTTVVEPQPSRDHTERLLRHLGVEVEVADQEDGTRAVSVLGQPELAAAAIAVPGDFSSAAFPLVAAALAEGSSVRLERVGINPLRTGLLDCLEEMGARIRIEPHPEPGGEPIADLLIEAGPLRAIEVPPERAPRMIDEYPILAVAAAYAEAARGCAVWPSSGSRRAIGCARSPRVLAPAACAVEVGAEELVIHGRGGPPPGGACIEAHHDHRIAMSFLVLGGLARAPVTVAGAETIETSFPGFAALMNRLGARIEPVAP